MKNKKQNKNKKSSKKPEMARGSGKIFPIGDRVVVRPFGLEEVSKSPSGIIIPDTVSKEKPEQGVVIAIGEGRWEDGRRVPIAVKVGDKVIFSRYGYDEVKVEGEEFYVLKEENVLAIIK